ncbi:MAG: DUF975 family protein [Candidatus Symbiothrix sp.]|jgi:uncharacterized membrane protein|nr:DUF975 family protein [Candidatus Symbiothrix sp.]
MTSNAELTAKARQTLEGKWGTAALGTLIYLLIIAVFEGFSQFGADPLNPFAFQNFWPAIVVLVIAGPLGLGYVLFIISLKYNEKTEISTIFDGFKQFVRALATYLLQQVLIFLYCLLLIIPGIIKALAYSMTFFILAEDSTIGSYDAILKSKELMYGYKWKYFCLQLRFIGWAILSFLTLGIGFIFLVPYIQSSNLNFYEDVKQAYIAKKTD